MADEGSDAVGIVRLGWCALTVLAVSSLVAACGASSNYRPPDVSYEPPSDRVYEASKERVWGGVLAVLVDLQAPINFMDAQSGLVRTGYAEPPLGRESDVLGCGQIKVNTSQVRGDVWSDPLSLPRASTPIRLTVLVRSEGEQQTSVRIRERSEVAEYQGVEYLCVPTGTLGERFLDSVGEELADDRAG